MFQSFEHGVAGGPVAARLAALRAELARRGADGFIVPRTDAHQGEVVAPSEERLRYLTGFTGSAGIAVVLGDRAALIVDGRYTLQAAQQVDAELIEVVPSHETPVAEWLEASLTEGLVLGYDPWLHGKTESDRLATAAERKGARFVPLEPNPVDAIWADRPAPPMGAVRIHPASLAGEDAASRRRRIGALIGEAGADCAVLTQPDSLAWLLNIRGSDLPRSPVALGFAILGKAGTVVLYMEPDKLDGAVRAHLGNAVVIAAPGRLADDLGQMGERTVLLDQASCPVAVAERLERAAATLVWGEDPCLRPKARKNATELAGMRAAHRRDGAAMVRFLHWLDDAVAGAAPLTEIDVVSALESFRAASGELMDIAFDTICGAGPNGAIVHYRVTRASNRTLGPGELLLVDSGGQYRDGTTDVTRTVSVGPADPAAVRPYTLVLKGMIAISRARWPKGVAGRDLDALARAALWRAGLDYDHGTGHGVGAYLNVHEGPQRLGRRGGEAELEPGMVLSNEPGYYAAGRFGIRIENLVAVTEPAVPEGGERPMLGFETLTLVPIDRRLIDPALLDAPERDWLDRYHARVLAELGPALEGGAPDWLAAACAPLG